MSIHHVPSNYLKRKLEAQGKPQEKEKIKSFSLNINIGLFSSKE
jgi:hypothetical protein